MPYVKHEILENIDFFFIGVLVVVISMNQKPFLCKAEDPRNAKHLCILSDVFGHS
jgi:hypothetical protein